MYTASSHRKGFRLFILIVVVCAFGTIALSSSAASPSTTVTITNNSSWEIRALYLSPADNDNWGDDQLNGSAIAPGASYSLNLSWDQSTVKLVAEDQDGCFISNVVDATSNSSWTISSSASRNCGSQ
jgi:hypothetical protein